MKDIVFYPWISSEMKNIMSSLEVSFLLLPTSETYRADSNNFVSLSVSIEVSNTLLCLITMIWWGQCFGRGMVADLSENWTQASNLPALN